MLERKLRENRHPRHAAEVRENIVPRTFSFLSALVDSDLTKFIVYSGIQRAMDQTTPTCTLFLHENILLRTLAYEQDLQKWRIAEIEAGRPDPGRPSYDEVSISIISGIRCHVSRSRCLVA